MWLLICFVSGYRQGFYFVLLLFLKANDNSGDEADAPTAPTAPTQAGQAQKQTPKQQQDPQTAPATTEDKWVEVARRHLSKFCVLVVEAGMTQTQLQNTLSEIALFKIKGGENGNVITTFDANLFGESITAPHVRKPPLQNPIVSKMWKAIRGARSASDQQGLFFLWGMWPSLSTAAARMIPF